MPHKDPEERRRSTRERMRRLRASGELTIDPVKEADRKFIWYHLQDGKEKLEAARQRRNKAAVAAKPRKAGGS